MAEVVAFDRPPIAAVSDQRPPASGTLGSPPENVIAKIEPKLV